MLLDGQQILDKKIVTFSEELVDTDSQIQPNGLDLRVDKIYRAAGTVRVPRDGKVEAGLQVIPLEVKGAFWELKPDSDLYWVDFLEQIHLPDGYCATLITRSSLVRAGVDVVSGLWDTGFYGQLGCTLRVHSPISIEWGAKLCQIQVHESKFNGLRYEGRYKGSNSQTAITT